MFHGACSLRRTGFVHLVQEPFSPHTALLTSVKYATTSAGSMALRLLGTFPEEVRIMVVLLVRCSGSLLPMIGALLTG